MQVHYQNTRFSVVADRAPGLKIYDRVLERVNLFRFGAFYDNMGGGYPPTALEAAKEVADKAEQEDNVKYGTVYNMAGKRVR